MGTQSKLIIGGISLFSLLAGYFYLTQEPVLNELSFQGDNSREFQSRIVTKIEEKKKEKKTKPKAQGSSQAISRSHSSQFNTGFATGGSGGVGHGIASRLGGGSGSITVTAKGSLRSIDMAQTLKSPRNNVSAGNPLITDNSWLSALESPQSTFSIDVDKASYTMIRRQLNSDQLPSPDEVRIEEMINYFDYNYPEPLGKDPYRMIMGMMPCPWQEGDQLARIALKSKSVDFETAPANNIVFLIDVSGSMHDADKLPLVVKSLKELVQSLRPQDRIGIVVYAGAAGVILESTAATEKNKIYRALESLQAGGFTAGGEGIQKAYQMAQENFIQSGNNRVILATDGDFNVGVSSTGELVDLIEKKRNSQIFLSVLGFGRGNYRDHQMEQLAAKGNGNYAYIDRLAEARKVLVKEMAGTLIATAKDVKIQVEFNSTQVESYRLIGYVNRKMANEDFDRDSVDAGDLGAAMNVTALYQIRPKKTGEAPLKKTYKYIENTFTQAAENGEWLTVNVRHKDPKENKSKLQSFPMHPKFFGSDPAMKWAASLAGFGMLLRNSKEKGNLNYNMVENLAKPFLKELDNHSDELLEYLPLVRKAKMLQES